MAILLNDNLNLAAPKPVDSRYGPYISLALAISSVPSVNRYLGLTVGVIDTNGDVVEYWFLNCTTDSCLVVKETAPNLSGISLDGGTY